MSAGVTGRNLVLKIGDGASPSEAFTTIAAARDHTVTYSETTVDTTNKDSSGNRTLLTGKVMQAVTVSFTGVFSDSQTIADISTAFRAGTHKNYQIDIDSTASTTAGELIEGAFRITSFERAGSHDGEINYSITLESDGAVSVT